MSSLLLSPASSAQTVTRQQLEAATRIECRFVEKVTTTWEEGVPSTTVESAAFELAFHDIDVESGTAEEVLDKVRGGLEDILTLLDGKT